MTQIKVVLKFHCGKIIDCYLPEYIVNMWLYDKKTNKALMKFATIIRNNQ